MQFLALILAVVQPTWTVEPKPVFELTGYRDKPFISIAGAATLQNGTTVVADHGQYQLYTYSTSGTPVAKFGQQGMARDGFRSMMWVGLCSIDTVSIYDPLQNRIVQVDSRGRYAGTRDPIGSTKFNDWVSPSVTVDDANRYKPPASVTCAPNGARATVSTPSGALPSKRGPHRSSVNVSVAPANQQLSKLGVFAGTERYRWPSSDGPRQLGKQLVVAVSPTRVYVGTADSFHIQMYDLEGVKQGDIRRKSPIRTLTPDDREQFIQRAIRRARHFGTDVDETKARKQFTADVLPKQLPPYNRFIVEGTRLWVQETPAPTDSIRHWWGFDERGGTIGIIIVPAELELYEISGTAVLGRWMARSGAESVRRYRLVQRPVRRTTGP